ncbi:MAG TPA: hypothetical protein VHA56_03135 [Mucilaginibacter sp.]|nr:hypothetical protein [Mucilaginibacter sp.]
MKWASVLKSSFHDPRCCDEGQTETAWRALVSSLFCRRDGSGVITGFAGVGTLEQYNVATGEPTGVTKANNPSDPDYIPDYYNTGMCPLPVPEGDPAPVGNSVVYAFNGCTGILVIQLNNIVTGDVIDIDVPGSGNITQSIPDGSYAVTMHVSQTGGLHVQMIANGTTKVVASDDNADMEIQDTAININVRPTNADITG